MPTAEVTAFWDKTKAQLAEVPIDASVEKVDSMSDLHIVTHRVTMKSFGQQKIRAWFTVPNGRTPDRGWPAVMVVPGYGGTLVLPGFLARFGYATLSLFPRSQGESLEEWQIERDTRVTYNLTDKEQYYYRGAYMDCIRGLDFLNGRPEADDDRLAVWGSSQGGGLTLATCSLDDRPKAGVAGVPWLCNFPVAAEVTANPYVELNTWLANHPDERDKAMNTLTYFDQMSLADGIDCPVLVSCAVIDEVHPYRTVMPVFDKIQSLKSVVVYPDTEVAHGVDFGIHGLDWLKKYVC